MTLTTLNKYQGLLEVKLGELIPNQRNRAAIAISSVAEPMDDAVLGVEREMAIRQLDQGSTILQQVTAALSRIEDGTYGVCLECDRAIPEKRLNAVPWAAYCVNCAERKSSEEEPDGEILATAPNGLSMSTKRINGGRPRPPDSPPPCSETPVLPRVADERPAGESIFDKISRYRRHVGDFPARENNR